MNGPVNALDSQLGTPEAKATTVKDAESSSIAVEPVEQPVLERDIPYAFAKANGVVLIPSEDGRPAVALREGADPTVLIEVRRYFGQPFGIRKVGQSEFDRFLHTRYAVDESAAGLAGAIDGNDECSCSRERHSDGRGPARQRRRCSRDPP